MNDNNEKKKKKAWLKETKRFRGVEAACMGGARQQSSNNLKNKEQAEEGIQAYRMQIGSVRSNWIGSGGTRTDWDTSLRAENKTTGKLQDFVACYTSNPTDSAAAIPLLPCSCCCGSEPTFLFALLSFTTPTSYSCWWRWRTEFVTIVGNSHGFKL